MKNFLLALTAISAMSLVSCSQEFGNSGAEPVGGGNKLSVALSVSDSEIQSGKTRVAAIEGEKKVNDLYLLFFESRKPTAEEVADTDRGLDAETSYYFFVDFLRRDNPIVSDLSPATGTEIEIDMSQSTLNVTDAYNVLGIANIAGTTKYFEGGASPEAWIQQWSGKTETEVIREAYAWTVAAADRTSKLLKANAPVKPDGLLMSGRATKAAGASTIDLTLVRNLIRFDVVVNDEDHTLESVAIYNAYPQSKIWNDGTPDGELNYDDSETRIGYYYGLQSDLPSSNGEKEVRGHFYVFENKVPMPVQNDKYTTCLIVGLRNDDTGKLRYHRVNVAPMNQAHILYRNNDYVLTINSVTEEGRESEQLAYDWADDNGLNYVINQWGTDETGTSALDGNSMLSSPYKTVNIDMTTGEIVGRADRNLPVDAFEITANSTKALNPNEELKFLETPVFYLNNGDDPYTGLGVELNGHTLKFTPVPVLGAEGITLQSGDKITGTITLGYAGLRISIDVIETNMEGDYLEVFLPDDGLPSFAPFAGLESGDIRVAASGSWSATILSDNPGNFAFVEPAGGWGTGNGPNSIGGFVDANSNSKLDVAEEGSVISWPAGNLFKVKTAMRNDDPNKMREAYIVVRLDKDRLNYYKMIRITQQQKSELAITPKRAVTFDGTFDPNGHTIPLEDDGDGLKGELAAIPGNSFEKEDDRFTDARYEVLSGTSGDGPAATPNDWTYRIEYLDDDEVWQVAYYEDIEGNTLFPSGGRGAVNGAPQWFTVTPEHTHPLDVGEASAFTVDVTGPNTSGKTRKGRVLVYPISTPGNIMNPDGAGTTKAVVNFSQLSSGISLSPNSVAAVAKTGGPSAPVTVVSDASLSWEIAGITVDYGSGKQATNHKIEVISQSTNPDTDEITETVAATIKDGTTTIEPGAYPVSTDKVMVRFPKIYYPNRNITTSVKVKLQIVDSELSQEVTFTQSPLTSTGMYLYAPQRGGYGNAHSISANSRFIWALRKKEAALPSTTLGVNNNYMHMNYEGLTNPAIDYWAPARNFRTQRDGLLYVVNDLDYDPFLSIINDNGGKSVLKELEYLTYPVQGVRVGNYATINTAPEVTGTKIYKMLIQGEGGGTTDIEGYINLPTTTMFEDDISVGVSEYPESAVPLVLSSRLNTGNPDVYMTIDPKNNFIFQGESQIFDTDNGNLFLNNFMVYLKLASMWGSAFTDLMVEDDQEGSMPAPWDAIWGVNAGISE
jgi:hypothetical protein